MYNNKYIKTKIEIYNDRIYTNFQYNKLLRDNECCAYLSKISLDSIVANADTECYPQIFLEESK